MYGRYAARCGERPRSRAVRCVGQLTPPCNSSRSRQLAKLRKPCPTRFAFLIRRWTVPGLGSTVIRAFSERPPHRDGWLSLVGTAGAPRAGHGEPSADGEQSQRDEADVPHGEHSKAYRLAGE